MEEDEEEVGDTEEEEEEEIEEGEGEDEDEEDDEAVVALEEASGEQIFMHVLEWRSVSRGMIMSMHVALIQPPVTRFSASQAHEQFGLYLWPSAAVLAACIAAMSDAVGRLNHHHPCNVRGLNVLELGCGCSLVGVTCAKSGAKQVVLTDHADFTDG